MTADASKTRFQSDKILEELFALPKWEEKPGSTEFTDRYVKLLTDLSVLVNVQSNMRKVRPKVFVARFPMSLQVESDTDVDVILAQVGYGVEGPVIKRELCDALSEEEFHQFICDQLASEVQAGLVSPVEINKLLEQE